MKTLLSVLMLVSIIGCDNADTAKTPARSTSDNTRLTKCDAYIDSASDEKIILFGDSRVEGFPNDKLGVTVINYGVGGNTAWGVLGMAHAAMPDATATAVIVSCGINDVLNYTDCPDAYGENLIDAIVLIKQKYPNAKVYITSVVPVALNWTGLPEAFICAPYYSTVAQNIAMMFDATYIELNSTLAPDGYLLPQYCIDNIHYTAEAYDRIIEIYRRVLAF